MPAQDPGERRLQAQLAANALAFSATYWTLQRAAQALQNPAPSASLAADAGGLVGIASSVDPFAAAGVESPYGKDQVLVEAYFDTATEVIYRFDFPPSLARKHFAVALSGDAVLGEGFSSDAGIKIGEIVQCPNDFERLPGPSRCQLITGEVPQSGPQAKEATSGAETPASHSQVESQRLVAYLKHRD